MAGQMKVQLAGRLAAATVVGRPPGQRPGGDGECAENDWAGQEMPGSLEQERDRLRQARSALENAAEELGRLAEQVLKDAEGQLVDLAVDIARKVLMQEIQAGRYEIEPIVTESLQHVPVRKDVVVHLNPDDLTQLQAVREDDGSEGPGNVRFVADPDVAKGGCVLVTAEGVVESAVETNLEGIAEALKETD